MTDQTWKTGDTGPAYTARIPLLDQGGSRVGYADLSGIIGVNFQMRKSDDRRYQVNRPAAVVGDPTDGRVSYSWAANDLSIAGEYEVQFEVTFGDGTIITTARDTITVERQ
jgi:hypothetical protein